MISMLNQKFKTKSIYDSLEKHILAYIFCLDIGMVRFLVEWGFYSTDTSSPKKS